MWQYPLTPPWTRCREPRSVGTTGGVCVYVWKCLGCCYSVLAGAERLPGSPNPRTLISLPLWSKEQLLQGLWASVASPAVRSTLGPANNPHGPAFLLPTLGDPPVIPP